MGVDPKIRPLLKLAGVLAGLGWLAAVLPLSGDEAYYWECGQRLDWSYFDQPGLVIWLTRGFTEVLGHTALAVRAPAILFTGLTGLLMFVWLGESGMALFLGLRLLPLLFFGSFYLSTDAGLGFFYLLAAYCFVRIRETSEWRWWLLLGAAIGLGFLAKFPIVLAAILIFFIPWKPVRFGQVLAAFGIASAFTAPVWIYAAHHAWANIGFQLFGRHASDTALGDRLLRFWGPQIGIVGPLLFPVALLALWRARREDRLLWAAGLIPIAFFGLLAFKSPMAPHWAAPGIPVLAVLASRHWDRRWVRAALAVNAALIAVLLALVLFPRLLLPLAPKAAGSFLGPARLREFVERAREPGEILATESYSTAALLNFQWGKAGEMLAGIANRGPHGLSYLYWQEPLDLLGRDLLFVSTRRSFVHFLRPRCERIESVMELPVVERGKTLKIYYIHRCRGLTNEDMFKP